MLNVGGRPFLDTLIDEIARYSTFEEILLLAGHRAEPFLARYSGAVRDARAQRRWNSRRSGPQVPWLMRPACCRSAFCFSTALHFSISIYSIWCGEEALASFIWHCAPTLSATDPAMLSSTTTGSRVHRARLRRPRSGRGRGLRDRPVHHWRHRPPPRFAGTGPLACARRNRALKRIVSSYRHRR
jgi:hypothetical protein